MRLGRQHQHFTQVKMQMAVAKCSWCDFVVFTMDKAGNKDLHIEWIKFDEAFWNDLHPKLTDFYKFAIIAEVASQRVYRGCPLYPELF